MVERPPFTAILKEIIKFFTILKLYGHHKMHIPLCGRTSCTGYNARNSMIFIFILRRYNETFIELRKLSHWSWFEIELLLLPLPLFHHKHFQEGISDILTFNWKFFNVFTEFLQLMMTYDEWKIRPKDIALTWREIEEGINKLL